MKKSLMTSCRALGAGIAVGLICAFFFHTGLFETLELKTLDFRFHRYADRLTPDKDIVIITIDQNSIDYLKYNMSIVWKWPRDVYAYVIGYLKKAGAKAVLLDFDFSDPDINRAEFEEGETDRLLGDAIKESGIVINSALFSKRELNERYGDGGEDRALPERFSVDLQGGENLAIEESRSVQAPIFPIMRYGRGLGSSTITADRDGIIRKTRLLYGFRGNIFGSSSLALVLSTLNTRKVTVTGDNKMVLGDQTIAVNADGEIYINWYGPGGPEGGSYKYFPMADVFLSALQLTDGERPVLDPRLFKDKIVLLGSTAPALFDLKPTSFSHTAAAYPGVEIVATVINNLLDGDSLSRVGAVAVIFLIFFVSVITALAVSYIRSMFRNIAITILIMAGVYYAAVYAFYHNLFLSITPVETGIVFSFIVVTVIKYLTEGKEKRWLKKAFSQYLSPSVIDEITEHPEKLKLGGEKREVTILFSDIRGFTSISEKLEPEQISNILNEYFTPMTEIIFRYNGTLDKYIGDAIMAFFGAPLQLEGHQSYACSAALEMITVLDDLKRKWQNSAMPEYIQRMNIGIGINSGPVSVGNMGSVSRFDYTVIGDNVNLSSRLEGINKLYGSRIIVSETMYKQTKDSFIYRELDNIKVAGKNIPIRIYELIKKRDDDKDAGLQEEIKRFEEGLELYRKQRWDDAYRVFTRLHQKDNSLKLYTVFMERCTLLKHRNLPKDWDGVYERRTK